VTGAGESLVQIARQLETHQALIERLERANQILHARLDGVELALEGGGRSRPPKLSAAATAESESEARVAAAESDSVAPAGLPAKRARPRTATTPKPAPVSRRPPRAPTSTTTSQPVKALQPRASRRPGDSPLPFSVESVDTWNGEKTVVVRAQGRLIDLRPGDSHQGWRIESAHGQTVTVCTPDGGEHTIEAGSEP